MPPKMPTMAVPDFDGTVKDSKTNLRDTLISDLGRAALAYIKAGFPKTGSEKAALTRLATVWDYHYPGKAP